MNELVVTNLTPKRIGFVLASDFNNPIPSTRIAVTNMFPFLKAAGFEPCVLFEPGSPRETPELPDLVTKAMYLNINIVVFQKIHGQSVIKQAMQLAAVGIKTLYMVCDLVIADMVRNTDATVVVTQLLKELHPKELQSKIHVVHDGIERPEVVKTEWKNHRGSSTQPLTAVLVTSAALDHLPVLEDSPDWLNIKIVGQYPCIDHAWKRLKSDQWILRQQPDFNHKSRFIKFLLNKRICRINWNLAKVYEIMQQADIGIIPVTRTDSSSEQSSLPPVWRLKSENRLTMKMSIGLPVIATPIPSYEPVIKQGYNGFLAENKDDWLGCLEKLRDPELRKAIGERARTTVLYPFSKEEQAQCLIRIINAHSA